MTGGIPPLPLCFLEVQDDDFTFSCHLHLRLIGGVFSARLPKKAGSISVLSFRVLHAPPLSSSLVLTSQYLSRSTNHEAPPQCAIFPTLRVLPSQLDQMSVSVPYSRMLLAYVLRNMRGPNFIPIQDNG